MENEWQPMVIPPFFVVPLWAARMMGFKPPEPEEKATVPTTPSQQPYRAPEQTAPQKRRAPATTPAPIYITPRTPTPVPTPEPRPTPTPEPELLITPDEEEWVTAPSTADEEEWVAIPPTADVRQWRYKRVMIPAGGADFEERRIGVWEE